MFTAFSHRQVIHSTPALEGINNKIKLIKRMRHGYRDTDYFFLKIKAAFSPESRDELKKYQHRYINTKGCFLINPSTQVTTDLGFVRYLH
ncbi:transposase [Vibrio chagasii]|nr:transposase [Vibrio chagasii]